VDGFSRDACRVQAAPRPGKATSGSRRKHEYGGPRAALTRLSVLALDRPRPRGGQPRESGGKFLPSARGPYRGAPTVLPFQPQRMIGSPVSHAATPPSIHPPPWPASLSASLEPAQTQSTRAARMVAPPSHPPPSRPEPFSPLRRLKTKHAPDSPLPLPPPPLVAARVHVSRWAPQLDPPPAHGPAPPSPPSSANDTLADIPAGRKSSPAHMPRAKLPRQDESELAPLP